MMHLSPVYKNNFSFPVNPASPLNNTPLSVYITALPVHATVWPVCISDSYEGKNDTLRSNTNLPVNAITTITNLPQ